MGERQRPRLSRSDESVSSLKAGSKMMVNVSMKRANYWIYVCLFVITLSGCSGIPTYPNTSLKNLHVTTRVDSGSASSSTAAAIDVHRVNARCETQHLGRVNLENGQTQVGIPVNETLFLDFIFASKRFLSSHISATRYSTLLTPRRGYKYTAQVIYDNDIYDVVIRQTREGRFTGGVIKRVPLSACKAR